MTPALHALHAALDARATPLPLFVRDDDAGWADDRLLALLTTLRHVGMPLDLAVIPLALGPGLARELRSRQAAGELGLHQHGLAHLNHEPEGRRCEFGPARHEAQQRSDLLQGWRLLHGLLGDRLDPFFTPPWNRLAPGTPALLAELGFGALSRDASAPAQAALPELRVHMDWSRWRRQAGHPEDAVRALAEAIGRHPGDGSAFGLMLHHAVMDDAELAVLQQALQALAGHALVRPLRMAQALACPLPSAAAACEAQPC